jgi:cytochrome b
MELGGEREIPANVTHENTPKEPASLATAADRVAVRVWDWPVRVVHWAVFALVVVSVATGLVGGNAMEWHLRSGFGILALVLFRILWGFLGSHHARFSSFVRGPAAVIAYARSLLKPPPAAYTGHNPLGGWVVVLLLAVLLAQAATGLFANDDVAAEGPLAKRISDDLSDWFTALHVIGAWVVVGLASVHVGAALFYLAVFKENLIRPMVTGVKLVPRRVVDAATRPVKGARALALLTLCAYAVWALVTES